MAILLDIIYLFPIFFLPLLIAVLIACCVNRLLAFIVKLPLERNWPLFILPPITWFFFAVIGGGKSVANHILEPIIIGFISGVMSFGQLWKGKLDDRLPLSRKWILTLCTMIIAVLMFMFFPFLPD